MTFKTRFQRLASLFSRKPVFHGERAGLTIKPSFALGGVQYYEIPGLFNMPYNRAMAARDVLMELDARVTREYLQAHNKRKKELYRQSPLDVLEMAAMDNELDQRTEWIASPEAIYKLAAVVYFDENESPSAINWEYCMEKIARWKRHKLEDFFLLVPIRKYIPYSELLESGVWKSESDMLQYIKTALEMEKMQMEALSKKRSST